MGEKLLLAFSFESRHYNLFVESPYHEVSGLPEAYEGGGGDACAEDKPAHLSLSYDESLESGYSTPNTRSRRVIREIIV